jgi:prepilin-type N-terminal cleavage/methylation domain-containing protein
MHWNDQRGFTLVEVMIATALGLIVSMGAFSFLEFTSRDVTRITERVHVAQAGRVGLEKIMLELHSVCVAPEVNPIVEKSGESSINFISETGEEAAFATVHEHVITYTPKSGKTEGTLTEQTFLSTGAENKGNYPFSTTASSTTTLLKGVKQTEVTNPVTKVTKPIPIFRYYRYYRKTDTTPTYGELDPTEIAVPLTKAEAEEVVKVTVSFTLAPEGKESTTFNGDRPVALEDSATFRLAPPSTSSGTTNSPCSTPP